MGAMASPSKQLAANMNSLRSPQNLTVKIPSLSKDNTKSKIEASADTSAVPHYGNQKRAIKPVLKDPNSPTKKIKSVLKNSPQKTGKDDKNLKQSMRDTDRDDRFSGLKALGGTRTVSFDVDK